MSQASTPFQIPTTDCVVRADIFSTAITLNTNILPTSLAPYHKPLGYFIIYCVFQAPGLLSAMRTKIVAGSPVTTTETLNTNTNLLTNGSYMFTVPVSSTDTINLQYSASTTLSKLLVLEPLDVES